MRIAMEVTFHIDIQKPSPRHEQNYISHTSGFYKLKFRIRILAWIPNTTWSNISANNITVLQIIC